MAENKTGAKPADKKPRNKPTSPRGNRYTKAQIEVQKAAVLEGFMANETDLSMAKRLKLSRTTVKARLESAIDDMRPHSDYDRYRALHLIDNQMMRAKLRAYIMEWEPTVERQLLSNTGMVVTITVDNIDGLISATAALLKVNEREAKLLLLDKAPPPSEGLGKLTPEEEIELFSEYFADVLADDASIEAFVDSVAKAAETKAKQ